MQLLLPAVLFFSCLAASAQGFLVPMAAPKRTHVGRLSSSSPSASEAVMFSTNPLAGRKVQFSDAEDTTERVTQVQLNPDGTLSMLSDNTNAVAIQGNWRPAEGDKFGFILERIYNDSGDSTYSMTRIYEVRARTNGMGKTLV